MLLLDWRLCFLVAIGESTGVGSEADLEGLCVPTVFLYVPTRVTQGMLRGFTGSTSNDAGLPFIVSRRRPCSISRGQVGGRVSAETQ